MNKILVIGGTGFIGSHLTEKLKNQGYQMAVLVRENSQIDFLKDLGVQLKKGDILNLESLQTALKDIDTVFCAVNLKPDNKSIEEYEKEIMLLHVQGTKNILAACRYNNVKRLIYFSSVAAMGYKKGLSFYNEKSQFNPVDTYGLAKLEAEKILNAAIKNKDMDVIILRPPGVFGERNLGALRKIAFWVKKGMVPVIGSGENKQSLIYVGNVVSQAVFLAERIEAYGKTYITSENHPYSVNQLINAVSKGMKKKAIKIHIPLWMVMLGLNGLIFLGKLILKREFINAESIIAISSERIFDSARLFKELGYKQEYCLDTAVERTIRWHNSHV